MSNETKQTLIVTRDGHLDEEWIADLEALDRRAAIKQAGQTLLNKLTNLPNRVGEITLNMQTIIEEHRI